MEEPTDGKEREAQNISKGKQAVQKMGKGKMRESKKKKGNLGYQRETGGHRVRKFSAPTIFKRPF
jgi:hypothetical protein